MMTRLQINLQDDAETVKIIELLSVIKGIKSVEIINEHAAKASQENPEKSKSQLENSNIESIVSEVLDIFLSPKAK